LNLDISHEFLSRRLDDVAWSGIRDIAAGSPSLRSVSGRLSETIRMKRHGFAAEMLEAAARATLAGAMARGLTSFLTRQYQYLHLDGKRQQDFRTLYARFIDELREACACARDAAALDGVRAAIYTHHDRLRRIVREGLTEAGALERVLSGQAKPLCAEYSPGLQWEILGFGNRPPMGPVLDLGCGAEARLVHYLRKSGRQDVVGLDSDAPDGALFLRRSWFDAPLAPASWGTIIAHQSFSLHFRHAHFHNAPRAEAFARHYMLILSSLRPGGVFAYAPGLPFIEGLLDRARWQVSARAIAPAGAGFGDGGQFTAVTVVRTG
jgi:SAM-dependent methyltransferase